LDKVDARGLSCPQPVLLAKKAVEKGLDHLMILVDNETAKNNVLRFLQHSGYTVAIETAEEAIQMEARKP